MLIESLLFEPHPCLDRCQIIYRPKFHTSPQLHLKANPREIWEFHVVPLDYVQRLLTEHHFLGKSHVRNYGCFLFPHGAAGHRHDGKLIDEPAIPRLHVAELGQGYGLAEVQEGDTGDNEQDPRWDMVVDNQ